MAKSNLKLYVWEGVLTDYSDGIMFALAHNVDEARKLIHKASGGYVLGYLKQKPRIVEEPEGFAVPGGG